MAKKPIFLGNVKILFWPKAYSTLGEKAKELEIQNVKVGENQTAYIKSFEMQKRSGKDQEYHHHSAGPGNLLSDISKKWTSSHFVEEGNENLGKKISNREN